MDLRDKLIEAEYVHRGDDGPYLGEQCGCYCDHTRLVNNDDSGRPCYRVCDKFKIKVSDYDSCKYFSDKKFMENIAVFAQSPIKKSQTPPPQKKQENENSGIGCALGILVAIAVVVYLILR